MLSRQRKWSSSLIIPILVLTAGAVRADQAANYDVSGSTGAAVWGVGNQPGTEIVAYAFSAATPMPGQPTPAAAQLDGAPAPAPTDDAAAASPRVAFSVTQWSFTAAGWVQRHWYGDWPLASDVLAIDASLGTGTLDTVALGTLEERTPSGTAVTRNVFGQLHLKWTGSNNLSNTSTAYTYQTPAFSATLQTAGSGRLAMASGTISVPALGAPISLWGVGNLSAVNSGVLNLTMQ